MIGLTTQFPRWFFVDLLLLFVILTFSFVNFYKMYEPHNLNMKETLDSLKFKLTKTLEYNKVVNANDVTSDYNDFINDHANVIHNNADVIRDVNDVINYYDDVIHNHAEVIRDADDGISDEDDVIHENTSCDCFGIREEKQIRTPFISCPDVPPDLVGRLNVSKLTSSADVYNKTSLQQLLPGGVYNHRGCKARDRVAVIIPYRDRARHLRTIVFHLHTVLQRQQLNYAIFVVEMAYPTQFNRGLLANVGFLTARDLGNYTCFIIHDVDLLPGDDRNLYRCADNPRHLAVNVSKYGYKLLYENYIGGAIAFTGEQFLKVNGFSNAYFGWGKEDDDLLNRIKASNVRYQILRPHSKIGVYEALDHGRDLTNPINPNRDHLYQLSNKRFKKDGVHSVLYQRQSLEFRPWYTWVNVKTSERIIMELLS